MAEAGAVGTPWRRFAFRAALTALALTLWFWTQALIGHRPLPASGVGDRVFLWTSAANTYLNAHAGAANALLIASSAGIDALGVFLLASWVFGKTSRPFLGLLIVLGLRQLVQGLVALPAPPHVIWHYPGFPSLLVTYGVSTDYFFSGHTSIAVFGATELIRRKNIWLRALAVVMVAFEIAALFVLRAHYTMDIFTGFIAALYSAHLAEKSAPRVDAWLQKLRS